MHGSGALRTVTAVSPGRSSVRRAARCRYAVARCCIPLPPSRRESCSCPTHPPAQRALRAAARSPRARARSRSLAQDHANKANWELAEKFSPTNLRSRVFTNAVNPHWLGQSDSLCYDWKDHNGSTFFLVVPTTKTKKPLFDQVKLAAQLSDLSHHAHDPQNLPFNSLTFSKDRKTFTFNADSSQLGMGRRDGDAQAPRIRPTPTPAARRGRGGRGGRGGVAAESATAAPADTVEHLRRQCRRRTCGRRRRRRRRFGGGRGGDFRNYSPDSSMFAFARDHNLYRREGRDEGHRPAHAATASKNYSFGARDTLQERQQQELTARADSSRTTTTSRAAAVAGGGGINRDPRVRANVMWSPDSKAFAVTRMDQRKVGELYPREQPGAIRVRR